MSNPSYVWRKIQDKSDFPQGLADLIREAYVLVHNGAEYAGIFVHDEARCWLGYVSSMDNENKSKICPDPDDARRQAETLMSAGMLAPRRAARF